jgi:putative ABC transport system permease protein
VERLRTSLALHPAFAGTTAASTNLVGVPTRMGFYGQDGTFKMFSQMTVDHEFFNVMGIEIVEGRGFSREYGTDPAEAVIVNEAFVRYFQWDSGLDKKIPGNNFPEHSIVGVVQDFHFQDLRTEVEPLALVLDPGPLMEGISDINSSVNPALFNSIFIRIQSGELPAALDLVKGEWKEAAPGQPFRFSFLEEDIQNQYREVKRWETVIGAATLFTILIACLGLFGLSALTVARRTKEIGVRKVLGASVGRIVTLLSKDFGRPVLAANLIAWPTAFYVMRSWLADFAFRIQPGILRFIAAAVLALAVALIAVSYQSIRAALTDPVRTIRCE